MRAVLCVLSLCLAMPAAGASLCGQAPGEALAAIAGSWEGDAKVSLENEVVSMMRTAPSERIDIGADGRLTGGAAAEGGFGTVTLAPATNDRYDVDAVDDLLDATENAVLADILSETPCGPEALPQFRAALSQPGDMSAEGILTLIAYVDDRILAVTELTLASEETVLYMTSTGLMRRLDNTGAGAGR